MRLIDADAFFEEYPELNIEPYNKFPTVEQLTDAWCTDCKEYDHEKNCCPRFNKVIRETLKDAQPNCSHCDYWNFSQKIIDIIVEVMTKYRIESVEDLQRELNRLKGGEEE